MRFKEGDKVEFIDQGELKQGVVTEIEETNHSIFYQIDYIRNMEITWITEDKLLSPAPVLKVPRFADDWISHCKQREYDLACLLDYEDSDMSAEMNDWLSSEDSNQELLMRAWLDGYEVEKEPLYYVKLIDQATGYLNVRNDGRRSMSNSVQNEIFKTQFTESEIKAMNKGEAYWLLKEPVEEVEGEA
ncbi:TPA: DUF1642 domain-containing protein [Listeria monocytogenes]|uniref:DUF1642 domain-containing protein n=1 Tax=Listeria monocytogenes TaxID=1639 RepID=UPI000BDEB51E|nr:DUF1642 domain-containing protein [Listeria monocytogenes]EAC6665672.1 DUF1642 domain-containing protein [Listeria monocytogenes]EAD6007090.1 DUF1642 domain-containing protein [Listeria monocytogenes]EAE3521543.1 DUF1642 domain-containing protein [Listeria monocytogenes]EAE3782471.1 DUF1642 domain-containing protein [Listeria monocytogenes]EAE3842077.1 DUF1642 domain-containing protein [Listeria monocytogenes]